MSEKGSDQLQMVLFVQEAQGEAFAQFSESYRQFQDAFHRVTSGEEKKLSLYGRPVRS